MIIKIKVNDVEKDIIISPKKKHRNKYLDTFGKLQKEVKSEDVEEVTATRGFIDFEDDLAVECSSLTQGEYDDLDLEEQAKITRAVRSIIFPMAGGDPALFFQK